MSYKQILYSPINEIKKKAVDRIKASLLRKDIGKWIMLDKNYRYTFAVLEKMRDVMNR